VARFSLSGRLFEHCHTLLQPHLFVLFCGSLLMTLANAKHLLPPSSALYCRWLWTFLWTLSAAAALLARYTCSRLTALCLYIADHSVLPTYLPAAVYAWIVPRAFLAYGRTMMLREGTLYAMGTTRAKTATKRYQAFIPIAIPTLMAFVRYNPFSLNALPLASRVT